MLTPEILRRELAADYVARGRAYADEGRVSDLCFVPARRTYTASVQGTQPLPYRVEAQLVRSRSGIAIYGLCACPVRVNCKHVAAVLWSVIDRSPDGKAGRRMRGVPDAPPPKAAAAPRSSVPAAATLSADWNSWLEAARVLDLPAGAQGSRVPDHPQRLLYVLDPGSLSAAGRPRVNLVLARSLKSGGYGKPAPWYNARNAIDVPPRFVTPEDQRLLRMLEIHANRSGNGYVLEAESGAGAVRAMLATGRCHWLDTDSPPLREGPLRRVEAKWVFDESGLQRVVFEADRAAQTAPGAGGNRAATVLSLMPPWYVDSASRECGLLETGLSAAAGELLAKAPAVAPEQAALVREALAAHGVTGMPLPAVPEFIERRDIAPVPRLRLLTLQQYEQSRGRHRWTANYLDIAALDFEYEGARAGRDGPALLTSFRENKVVRIKRDRAAEKSAHAALAGAGFIKVFDAEPGCPPEHRHDYTLVGEQDWFDFMVNRLPQLRAQGWRIDCDEHFRFATVEAGEWRAQIRESGHDWFDLSLEVDVGGKRVNLIPLLVTVIRDHPGLLSQKAPSAGKGHLFVRLDDGRLMPVPLARVRPLIAVLHDLLNTAPAVKLRLPRLDALRLADLDDSATLKWQGGEALRALGRKLAEFKAIAPVAAPAGFGADLRPYQAQGLAWLQFLSEYGLGGILADDMGLGKTVQALAHILIEKQAGRMEHPVLVVAPTSVVPNWKAEAARFAPQLRVHVSHGLKRKEAFGEIAAADLVLTTYALLPRDEKILLDQPFHLVILDEAQQIKNAHTHAARVVGRLRANHRLCLTGTPLENHLGELWSLFHFLMPGLLGDAAGFRRAYRTPIEKHADGARREQLVRRMRPFLLRRTKDQVATELPPKSEILRQVELAGPQRDLYETVRASMHERVRAEIAARGLAQSHIIVLDALLKLRQICCDPRLLKIDAAKHVRESAKLQLLLDMLQELLPEGRRVLLFSQFTSMLDLIEPELAKLGIAHVRLTGQTRDRERPVKAFQSGKVPLFLISLKAGGTGLNLTAADTVIHYDPWWNPAVENQATGRAHRIGQVRPVFVYKLIVSGSVEEKIAAMQASKAALARGVLENEGGAGLPLTAEDIQALFEPLR